MMTTLTHKVNNSHLGCCVTSQLTMAVIGYWDVVLFGTKLMLELEFFAVKLTLQPSISTGYDMFWYEILRAKSRARS
jgi:hypothetical protein